MAIFSGFSSNGLPYARISDSGPALVVFNGSEIEHKPPSKTTQQSFLLGLRQLVRHFTVYVFSRKPNLPRGYTAQDISNDFAETIRTEIGGSVHILSMSSGGSSAMHFAVDHPQLVNKLVLAMTAHQLNDYGKEICTIWRDLALAGDWPKLWERMGIDANESPAPEWVIRPMMRWFGGALLGKPESGQDMAVVLESDINLDVIDKLPEIKAPTLVMGGGSDPFYGADNIRKTAKQIPNAKLTLIEGGRHAIVKTHTKVFQQQILDFLS